MAKSLVTDAGQIFRPGAYAKYTVQSNPAGLATTGVLMLVGEADAGPDYSLESDLEATASYGPDQVGDVIAKYKSGPIVDAFRAAASAANDPDLVGSFSRAIILKTNPSVRASANLPKVGGGTYAVLANRSYGKPGNEVSYRTTSSQAEVVPTTGSFTYIPAVGTVAYSIRSNGAATVGGTLGANTAPDALVTALAALTGITASGGIDRVLLTVLGTLATSAIVGNSMTLTRSIAWNTTPTIGDTLIIPTGSVIAGAGSANVGAYVITAVTATTLTATKLSDAGKGGAVIGTITAPVVVAPAAISAVTDAKAWSPVTISQAAATTIDGVGKSLEISQLTTGTDLLSRTAFSLGTTTAVTWVSKSGTPALLTATEGKIKLALARASDFASEEFIVGGEIALKISYQGTTATLTITDTTLTTTVAGGSGASLSLALKDYKTVSALAAYINTQTGYVATAGNAQLGNLPSTALDNVTAMGIASDWSASNGRVKVDAYRFFNALQNGSSLVQIGLTTALNVQAGAGLPDVMAAALFLAGGAKGATTDAIIVAAIDKLALVKGNFLVPLFSRDASYDILDDLTESASTYTIAGIHAAAKSHVLAMSTVKRRKNRQTFLSIADSFTNSREISANIASFRASMTFQDFKQTGSDGSIVAFQPWMGAVLAASMQAAGFYKNIEFKGINTSGITSRAGDFTDRDDTQMEDALKAGLMPAARGQTGGFIWASDQTTYGRDENFVFNSVQAVYAADTVALSTAQAMEVAFAGQSTADISASAALSFLESIMANMLRLKLIAPSDGAEKGFKNARIQIRGNAMYVSVEIKLATAIDFIMIDFLVSPVQQTAGI
jgi:hypothetical protein